MQLPPTSLRFTVTLKNNDYWLKYTQKKQLAILQNLIKEKTLSPFFYDQ